MAFVSAEIVKRPGFPGVRGWEHETYHVQVTIGDLVLDCMSGNEGMDEFAARVTKRLREILGCDDEYVHELPSQREGR